jgi:hypothetical protein
MVHAIGAQMRAVDFVVSSFTDMADLVVRNSVTNNGLQTIIDLVSKEIRVKVSITWKYQYV